MRSDPASPSSGPRRDKERCILTAAVAVFGRRGYHQSSIAHIAEQAGVATGTIYLYFEKKEDLLTTLFRRFLHEYLEECRPLLAREPAGGPRLRKLVELHLRFFDEDPERARVFQIHLREVDPVIRDGITPALREYVELIDDTVEAGKAAGDFDADLDPHVARNLLFGGLNEVVVSWLYADRKFPLMDSAAPCADALVRAFRPVG